jgi:acyl-CoA dehydrogenase
MAELGWLGLQIPQEYGGLGLGFFDLCILLEEAGRELMPEPFVSTLLLGTQALLLGGTDAQKRASLSDISTGEKLVSVAYEEPGSRDLHRVETVARPSDDGFEITGEKIQVLDGHLADAILVSAATEGGAPTLFLVDSGAQGMTRTRQFRIDGHGAAIVRFEGVKVASTSVVGERGKGASLLQRVLDRAAIGLAAHMLGASEQAFAETLAYLKERKQFDVPIGSFQALQHRAVALYTEIALLRSVVLAGARVIDERPNEVPRFAALAKSLASETFLHVAREAIQMHGGLGVTDEHDIGLYIKRAQATYVTFGEPSQHRRRWAELHGY